MLVACDLLQKNGGGSSASVSVTLKRATGDCAAGNVFVVANCISQWELELDFGENAAWATLSHTSGQGYKSNIQLNYDPNTTGKSRSLSIILTSGNKKSETVFTQNSKQNHDYKAAYTKCGWLELPETKEDDGLDWCCHYFNINGETKRNYSFYYSYADYVSLWVAYPLNSDLIGSGSRTNAWAYDPLIPIDLQINIVDGKGTIPGYQRGHQLPSADRYSGNSNPQTFYSTNMTPQRGQFNENIWAGVEEIIRNWAPDSEKDTLYVVTGCTVKDSKTKAYDLSGHSITVPTAYWKACLKYTNAYGWTACGIWLDHYTSATSITRNDLFSIDELENKIGIDLFVNLPKEIGAEKAAKVESTKPTESAWPI